MFGDSDSVASIILGPMLEDESKGPPPDESKEGGLSANDEFMAQELMEAIDRKDGKGLLRILRFLSGG